MDASVVNLTQNGERERCILCIVLTLGVARKEVAIWRLFDIVVIENLLLSTEIIFSLVSISTIVLLFAFGCNTNCVNFMQF